MINEMSVHARSTNKKANLVVAACFISTFILLIVSALVDAYRGLFSMLIFIFMISTIFFYTKFMAARYVYDLTTDEKGAPILITRNIIGKRETTLMRIDLGTVASVERVSREELKKYRPETGGVLRYVYSPTFLPDSLLFIKSRSSYEKADILIEAPDEFGDLIRRTAEYVKEKYGDID